MKKLLAGLMALTMVLSLSIPALASSYSDVSDEDWYAEAVEELGKQKLMMGYGDGMFHPERTFNRAQLAVVLYRMAGSPAVTGEDTFSDTQPGQWYSDAVLWAQQNEVVGGYSDGEYKGGNPATQEQLTVMLWRKAGARVLDREKYASEEGVENKAGDWAFDAVVWAKAEGLIADLDAFEPKEPANRGQVADMVYRYLDRVEAQPEPQTDAAGNKVLVAYFSCTSNTENVAKIIADATGAALYQITPETPYTSADLNYNDTSTRATREQNDDSARPAISGEVENMAECDVIFLGYPIWWGQAPKIMYTFVESYDLAGKTVVPFCTSGSSSIGSSATNLQKSASEAKWLEGNRFSGSASRESVVSWVNSLDLDLAAK